MPEAIVTTIGKIKDPTERFFAYARERHVVYLRRAAGLPEPWTDDPVLQHHRFTNVYRELDKTTAWFREHVRGPLRDRPEVLLATVLFRMLNRIEVGEALFVQQNLLTNKTAFQQYVDEGDWRVLRAAIRAYVGVRGPYVTGAYIISTPPGRKKLDGALWVVDQFAKGKSYFPGEGCEESGRASGEIGWRAASELMSTGNHCLEDVFEWLRQFDYLGKFHSYEIVTDLRHTALLENAPDVLTWANMGPGARRGLNRIHERGREKDGRGAWGAKIPEEQALQEMRDLLKLSRRVSLWPTHSRVRDARTRTVTEFQWPRWELREVEHLLCEFDKYDRTRLGEGRPRGVFR